METTFKIRGAKEFEKLLKALGPKVAGKVADAALRAGAKPILAEAKRRVPKRTRTLERALAAQLEKRRAGKDQRNIFIGARSPVSRRAHLTEFGTVHSAAQPFLRPAVDTKANEAIAEMGKVLGDGIETEAAKLAKP